MDCGGGCRSLFVKQNKITMWRPDVLTFSQRQYMAPTVFLRAGKFVSNYNYYATLEAAIRKYAYLNNLQGGRNEIPAGSYAFKSDGTAQTFGINCDFYVLKNGKWQLTSYDYVRSVASNMPPVIFRFLLPSTMGPYFAIFSPGYFGLAAQTVSNVDPDKLKALDDYWRAAQVLKYRYNSLVGFLNDLARRQLNTVEQQIFNEGLLLLNSMNQQMATIRGLEIGYNDGERIGIPVIALIAVIAVLGGATAWTVASIVQEREKTDRINSSYDLQKWVANKQTEVAQMAQEQKISVSAAQGINQTLSAAAAQAREVADKSSQQGGGLLSDVSSIVKWGVLGLLGYGLFNLAKKTK